MEIKYFIIISCVYIFYCVLKELGLNFAKKSIMVFPIRHCGFGARIQGAFIMSGGQMSNEIFLSKEKERFIGRVSQTAMEYIASSM